MESILSHLKDKRLITLLLISFTIRVAIFFRFQPWDESILQHIILIFDSLGYHNLAICMSSQFSFCDEVFRTPGYPFFTGIIYYLFGPQPAYVLFIQIFFNLLSIYLIYLIATELLNKNLGLIAALLFSIDPHHTIFIYYLLTETIYTSVFLLAFYIFIIGLKNNKFSYFIIAGLIYGVSTLIRPITQYYIIALSVFVILWYIKNWKQGILFSALLIFGYMATTLPWCYRNYHNFGYFKISNIKGYSFLFWDASYYEAKRQNKTIEEINKEFYKELYVMGWRPNQNPFVKEEYLIALAKKTLSPNFPDYVKTHLIGAAKIHLSVGTQSLTDVLRLPAKKWTEEEKYTNGVIPLIQKFFATKTIYEILLGSFVAVFLGIVYFFAAIGIWRMIREKQILLMLFLLGSAGYFALISGIVSYARYRLPSMPFYILLACFGMAFLWDKYQKKKLSAK